MATTQVANGALLNGALLDGEHGSVAKLALSHALFK